MLCQSNQISELDKGQLRHNCVVRVYCSELSCKILRPVKYERLAGAVCTECCENSNTEDGFENLVNAFPAHPGQHTAMDRPQQMLYLSSKSESGICGHAL